MLLIALLLTYLIGAVPFGLIVGKLRGVDVRDVGSGNIGATNVWRTLGPGAGSLVFALDVLKGVSGPLIGKTLVPGDDTAVALCAAMAVAGHIFSVFLKFRGGKGIATALGAITALMPWVALLCFVLWGVVLAATRMVGAASVAACLAVVAMALAFRAPLPYLVVIVVMAVIALVKHLPNIKRILAGTEPKIGQPKNNHSETANNAPAAAEVLRIERIDGFGR